MQRDRSEWGKKYRAENKEKIKERLRLWHIKNKERRKEYNKKYKADNYEKVLATKRARCQAIRIEVLTIYSKGIPKCACCGETENQFLSIDHINGRTKEEKKRMGYNLYSFLKKNPIDPNLQVLCHNCNLAKGFYGQCPHKLKI